MELTDSLPGIYKITNKKNGHFYVGGTQKRIKERFWQHRQKLRKNLNGCAILQNAWNKYGEDLFSFEVIENCLGDKASIEIREDFYIETLKPQYNIFKNAHLAKRFKMSKKVLDKLKQKRKKWNHSEEAKEKIRKALTGKPKEESHNKAVSKALKKSSAAKDHLKELHKNRKRPIIQLDKDTKGFIMEWDSAKTCCKSLKIHASQLGYHLRKTPYYNQVKGFIFIFKDEYESGK